MVAFVNDRICKVCKTRYAPPTPRWAGTIFVLIGYSMVAGGIIDLLFRVVAESPFVFLVMPIDAGSLVLGVIILRHGMRSLIRHAPQKAPTVPS